MKSKEIFYLSLEPYVHGVVKENKVLLFNTLNKKHLILTAIGEVADLVSQLLHPSNGGVVEITREKLLLPPIKKFVQQIRRTFMGELFPSRWSEVKPVNFLPIPIIKESPFSLEDNLHEISLHLNDGPEPSLIHYQNAFFQFLFPKITSLNSQSLDIRLVKHLIDEVEFLPILTINLLGFRIFDYPELEKLMKLMQVRQFRKKIHIPLQQLEPGFLSLARKNTRLVLFITFPVTHVEVVKLAGIIQEITHKDWVEFNFIVQDQEEVEQSVKLIQQLELHNVYFKPFFNGNNISFFETTVFMTESDIVASKPSQKQILSRYSLNENDFGKIILLPDGKLYSNVNEVALGSLRESSVTELIKKERKSGSAWKRIRMNEEPCKRCIYHFLCPPVSNYELYLKKFNLCHIEIT